MTAFWLVFGLLALLVAYALGRAHATPRERYEVAEDDGEW